MLRTTERVSKMTPLERCQAVSITAIEMTPSTTPVRSLNVSVCRRRYRTIRS